MSAHVQSLRAISEFRSALCTFIVEARQALAAIEMEARRAIEYITNDQAQAWQSEARRGREKVQQCKLDVHKTQAFKRIGHYTPSCIDEKKELGKAERRVQLAESKLQAVRHWGRVAEQAFREFHSRLAQFVSVLDGDLPKALASLERVLAALDRYLAVEAPSNPTEGGHATVAVPATEDDIATAPGSQPATEHISDQDSYAVPNERPSLDGEEK